MGCTFVTVGVLALTLPTPPQHTSPRQITALITGAPSMGALLGQYARYRERLNHIHMAAFWTRFGLLSGQWSASEATQLAALEPIVQLTLEMVPTSEKIGCRQLTGIAHGLAKNSISRRPAFEPLWGVLADAVEDRLHEYRPREIATTAWAFAKADVAPMHAPLFAALAVAARPSLSSYTPQGLANLAWAYAKAGHAGDGMAGALLFDEMMGEACSRGRLVDFASREVASLAWAYATAGHPNCMPLFEEVAREARGRLGDFSLHELGVLGWSFAAADAVEPGEALFGRGSSYVQQCELLGLADAGAYVDAGTLTQLHQWELWRREVGARRDAEARKDEDGGRRPRGQGPGARGQREDDGRPRGSSQGPGARGQLWAALSPGAADRCVASFGSEAVGEPSGLESSVRAALEKMGLRTTAKVHPQHDMNMSIA